MIIQTLVDLVGLGTLYALLTVGIALLFGILGLVNFAYGEIIMVSALTLWILRDIPWGVAVPIAILAGIIVSVLTERLAFRPLRGADAITLMIASFAVSTALQAISRMFFIRQAQGVPPQSFLTQSFVVWGVRLTVLQIVTVIAGLTIIVALAFLLQRTKLGTYLRASAENFDLARQLGIRGNLVITSAFVITGFIAAISAIVLVSRQGSVSSTMGLDPLLIGVVGAVLGGLNNLKGAAIGGFLLGAASVVIDSLLPSHLIGFRDALLYSLVILVFAFRTEGLFKGMKVRTA